MNQTPTNSDFIPNSKTEAKKATIPTSRPIWNDGIRWAPAASRILYYANPNNTRNQKDKDHHTTATPTTRTTETDTDTSTSTASSKANTTTTTIKQTIDKLFHERDQCFSRDSGPLERLRIRYIPLSNERDKFRTIKIEGLPLSTTMDQVTPNIREGMIYSIHVLNTESITGYHTCLVTFVNQIDATRFLGRVWDEDGGVWIGGYGHGHGGADGGLCNMLPMGTAMGNSGLNTNTNANARANVNGNMNGKNRNGDPRMHSFTKAKAKATLINTPTYPIPKEMKKLIFEKGHTRCISIKIQDGENQSKTLHNVLSSSYCGKFIEYADIVHGNLEDDFGSILTLQPITKSKSSQDDYQFRQNCNTVTIRFHSIPMATVAFDLLGKHGSFRSCPVWFVRDPCDCSSRSQSQFEDYE